MFDSDRDDQEKTEDHQRGDADSVAKGPAEQSNRKNDPVDSTADSTGDAPTLEPLSAGEAVTMPPNESVGQFVDEATIPPDSSAEAPTMAPASDGTNEQVSVGQPGMQDYEILEEIGRGGMGVVYKARDKKLDRVVALKMILGGSFVGSDEIDRFRIEAESAARLDHSGIVPIYEIGQSSGNHFFSMKYIDGKPLSDLGDNYQSETRSAVELMVVVANAVQHAHQRGVLHRDLKPANILIDHDGSPLITDLGLAKQLDNETGLTRTGHAMGTPGFMPPEQAAGDKDVTTAADVFALGAILFWLQTGKSPYGRESAMSSLLATINEEPPKLRKVLPGADSDLELICDKAMSRDPRERYASAADFARDLQAWLDGELLSVRAPTAVSVASIWVRKNMRVVLGAFVAGMVCGLLVTGMSVINTVKTAAWQETQVQELGHDETTWITPWVGVRHLNDWWQLMQLFIVPMVAMCAIANIWVLKPQNRESNMIASFTAAMTAGVFAVVLGIGWNAQRSSSVDQGLQDIELLANAVWVDSDRERELVRETLMQRYPGLEDMDLPKRQWLVRHKIQHDQNMGIIPGIWRGIGIALCFVAMPMFATCYFAGLAWIEGLRGWEWFGNTCERCAFCMVFFIVLAYWFMSVPPSLAITLLVMAVMTLGLYAALQNARWYWRVLLGSMTFLSMFVVNYERQTLASSANRVGLANSDDELRDRLPGVEKLMSRIDDPELHYQVGIGWLSVDEVNRYQEHCQWLRDEFVYAYRPQIGGRLAKIMLLAPDQHSQDDLAWSHHLADMASGWESSPLKHWFWGTRALSELRQGNMEAVFKWTAKAREVDEDPSYLIALCHMIDALAHQAKGETELAQKSSSQGKDEFQSKRDQSFGDGHDVGWVNWRAFLILQREYESGQHGR